MEQNNNNNKNSLIADYGKMAVNIVLSQLWLSTFYFIKDRIVYPLLHKEQK